MLAALDTDTDEEVIVDDGKRKYHIKGKRATSLLDQLFAPDSDAAGAADDDDGDGDSDGGDGDGDDGGDADPAGMKDSVWNRRGK
jgi:hypothetical protein